MNLLHRIRVLIAAVLERVRGFFRDEPGTPPLARTAITEGSKLMVWAYPTLLTAIGLLFILQPPVRMSSDAFDVGKAVMPLGWGMDGWGILFCWTAAGMYAAAGLEHRQLYVRFLVVGAALIGFWCTLTLISTVQSPVVSLTAPVWVGFPIVCLVATARSLRRDWVWSRGPQQ